MGIEYKNKWVGKIKGYEIESFPENAFCKLNLTVKTLRAIRELSFDIPYDSEVYYGDITLGEKYIIDYINSGPHCQYVFKKGL